MRLALNVGKSNFSSLSELQNFESRLFALCLDLNLAFNFTLRDLSQCLSKLGSLREFTAKGIIFLSTSSVRESADLLLFSFFALLSRLESLRSMEFFATIVQSDEFRIMDFMRSKLRFEECIRSLKTNSCLLFSGNFNVSLTQARNPLAKIASYDVYFWKEGNELLIPSMLHV